MNYKFAVPLEKYDMKTGSDTRNFKVKKTEDKVVLRFDEENQVFYARIYNPSQHTRYLYQQHRLAIALCKLNTGRSQRRHMGSKYWPGDRYWDEETQEWEGIADFYVKKKCHPRWSRCGESFVPVITLDEEIEINYDIHDLIPNQKHTAYTDKWKHKWYGSIKVVLLSSTRDLSDFSGGDTAIIYSARAYRTMCKRIKIEYDSENERIIHRINHSSNNPYSINVEVTQNNREITFNITDMGYRVLRAFRDDNLWIGLDFQDISFATNHGGISKRVHNGDHWEEEGPDTKSYKSRRYEYRLTQKWYCPSRKRTTIEYNEDDTITITYTVPDEINAKGVSGSGIFNLLRLMNRHDDVEPLDIKHRMPRVVIGMTESDVGRRLFKYSPNLIVDFIYSDE